MSIEENEAIASLRLLVAVARADGSLHQDERRSLAAALESFDVPAGITIDGLLSEPVDVAAQLAELKSDEARQQIYRSAFFMAHADGSATKEEQALLDQIGAAVGVGEEERARLERMFVKAAPTASALSMHPIDDPAQRSAALEKLVLRYAALTAALGAFPIPGVAIATDLGVVALQVKMVREIGRAWGNDIDLKTAKSMLYGLGLGTGARLAVNNLAKLVPGWGSAVGAATSFASTYGVGKVMQKYFASDGKGDVADLTADFQAAQKEGKAAFAEKKDEIAAQQRETEEAIAKLTADFKAGVIDQEELDRRLAELTS